MMQINKDYTDLNFKDESELLDECEKLISGSDVLDPILQEIKTLKRGEVSPESTLKRSKTASYFTSEIQQIFNYIYRHETVVKEDIITKLDDIVSRADAVLRENIVLQSKPPLDVIKFKNVPVRYSHSTFGHKERRWGYGLHKLPTTELGYSICLADMPPRYIQSYHNHTISEYTLALDKKIIGIANPGKNEKKHIVNTNEIVHFSATTPHTLYNPANSLSRNISVKTPTGLLDWRPLNNLNPMKRNRTEILKGKLSRLGIKGGTKLSFSIKDRYYDYVLEILELKEDSVMEDVYDKDKYFLVIEGDFLVSSNGIKKQCSKNDYIVIDKNTDFNIKTKTKSRLYTIS
jgi:mannose-6-phosphate isomerase-like protein (cupin superfamily)